MSVIRQTGDGRVVTSGAETGIHSSQSGPVIHRSCHMSKGKDQKRETKKKPLKTKGEKKQARKQKKNVADLI